MTLENLGFPQREQLKGIVETAEVLAYKAMPFAMDHFALECVGGCVYYMSVHVCLCVCVLLCECPSFWNSLIPPSSSSAAAPSRIM